MVCLCLVCAQQLVKADFRWALLLQPPHCSQTSGIDCSFTALFILFLIYHIIHAISYVFYGLSISLALLLLVLSLLVMSVSSHNGLYSRHPMMSAISHTSFTELPSVSFTPAKLHQSPNADSYLLPESLFSSTKLRATAQDSVLVAFSMLLSNCFTCFHNFF